MKKFLILFFLVFQFSCSISDPEMMELLREIKAQNETLLEDVEEMRSQLDGLDGKYQVILASLADNKKELEVLKNQVDALKAQLTQQLDKINQLSTQLEVQGADVKKLSAEIAALKANCEELKDLIEELLSDKSPIPTNGLIAWYPFNGNANDESGNNNNGTVIGASLTPDRSNLAASSYDFNGTTNYISLKNTFFVDPSRVSTFSYSFWLNPSSFPQPGKEYMISGKEGFWRTIGVAIRENGEIVIKGSQPSPQNYFSAFSRSIVVVSKWQHVTITFNNGLFSLYLNGVLTNSESIAYTSIEFAYLQSGNSTSTNLLGAINPVSPGITNYYQGKLDDFGIWNRALTSDEILKIYKGDKF